MIILDYLFFYLTYWFTKNSDKLKWSSPVERSSYVIGIATTTFLVSIAEILAFTLYKDHPAPIPKIIFVGVGLGIMYLYDYIYIKKDRYSIIRSKNNFNTESYANGIIISWIVIVICVFLPFIIFMFFVPFGGQRSMIQSNAINFKIDII
jgi:hypothetical protein